jgi:hypothetical protein
VGQKKRVDNFIVVALGHHYAGVYLSFFQKGLMYRGRKGPEQVPRAEMHPLGSFICGRYHGLSIKTRQFYPCFFPLGFVVQFPYT